MAVGFPGCVGLGQDHKNKHSKCFKSHLCGLFYSMLVCNIKELCTCETAGPQLRKLCMQKKIYGH